MMKIFYWVGKRDPPEAVAEGILAIVRIAREKWAAGTKLLVASILPRQSISLQKSIEEANAV